MKTLSATIQIASLAVKMNDKKTAKEAFRDALNMAYDLKFTNERAYIAAMDCLNIIAVDIELMA